MRFLADMGISPKTVAWLQAGGHDAAHVAERGYHQRADADILALAKNEERVVLTHDLGFGTLMVGTGRESPSIVIFRLSDMQPDNVIRYLTLVLTRYQSLLQSGAILSVSERRIRARRLPL